MTGSRDIVADVRREPRPDLEAVGESTELLERIRTDIRLNGPITFARFMERALYEPGLGYYRSPDARPGRAGDFLTAPEADPIFGTTMARQLAEVWRRLGEPDRFIVREPGAGTGTLAIAILRALAASKSSLVGCIRWQPEEIEPARLDAFGRALAAAGFPEVASPDDGPSIVGAIVANEVLDALAVHRVVGRPSGPRELFVGLATDGPAQFVHVEGDPSDPRLAARLSREGIVLADGQRAEICLAVHDWVSDQAARLERGVLIAIDYGYPAAELYDPIRRAGGTLRAYVRHRVHDDPFRHVGRQDLTAHVDVTAVEQAAADAALDHLGTTTQAEFLTGLGIGEILVALQADPATTLPSYLATRAAVMRMLDPAAMGRFRVMVFGRGIALEPPLAGLAYRIPPRT
ncbi:MAG: SAM-dependent methyltransferase [Chloroflexota bacterium]